jgi:hypothetical protein
MERLVRGAPPEEINALEAVAFRENGPFYRVGYRMAKRIDTVSGRRPFLSCIRGGPLRFFETYLRTRPSGPERLDADTEREIRRIIREIRALGDFDPDG